MCTLGKSPDAILHGSSQPSSGSMVLFMEKENIPTLIGCFSREYQMLHIKFPKEFEWFNVSHASNNTFKVELIELPVA